MRKGSVIVRKVALKGFNPVLTDSGLQTEVVKDRLVTGRWKAGCVLYSVPQKGMEQLRKHAAVEINN